MALRRVLNLLLTALVVELALNCTLRGYAVAACGSTFLDTVW